jgi:undecaprenyl-diphosphatase
MTTPAAETGPAGGEPAAADRAGADRAGVDPAGADQSGAEPTRSEAAPPPREGFAAALDRVRRELGALDLAVYDAVAGTPSPTIDAALARISNAANHSRLWVVTAGVVSLFGKEQRRSALVALAAVGATSAVGNLAVKPVLSRGRPERTESTRTHKVRMPESHSFPSGHAASAFAFSSALGAEMPALATPLRLMATTVAYSRVHTGVHYPGDVVIGALIGAGLGTGTRLLARRVAVSGR